MVHFFDLGQCSTMAAGTAKQRDAVIERLGIDADTRDLSLNRIVKLTAIAMGCPMASFSVRYTDDQIYVATHGFEMPAVPAEMTICGLMSERGDPCEVSSLSQHPEFKDNPVVTMDDGIEFYASHPVFAPDGQVIGVLCVMDTMSRSLSLSQLRLLGEYAAMIEDALELRSLSIRDTLTRLYNRRYFDNRGRDEWRRAMRHQVPITIALVDVDYFKQYNDHFGHQRGDEALMHVADCLNNSFHRVGDIVSRYGGEEFALLLPTTPMHHAEVLLDRVRENILGLGIAHPDSDLGLLTVSIGIACADSKEVLMEHDLRAFLDRSDQALYEAKKRGRNRIAMYHPDEGILDKLAV